MNAGRSELTNTRTLKDHERWVEEQGVSLQYLIVPLRLCTATSWNKRRTTEQCRIVASQQINVDSKRSALQHCGGVQGKRSGKLLDL